jgi:hypothetical protein
MGRRSLHAHALNKVIIYHILYLPQTVWPDGVLFTPGEWASADECEDMRLEAKVVIKTLLPGGARTFFGEKVSERALKRLFRLCQTDILTQHLSYTMLDQLILGLFPSLKNELHTANT